MIFYLQDWLRNYFTFFNVFGYITFRTFMAVITAFLISMFIYPRFIAWMRREKTGQNIRKEGPSSHFVKKGTPTMGGLVILLSIIINIFLWTDFIFNSYVQLVTFTVIAFGALGFYDDILNVMGKEALGLRARKKLIAQIVISLIFMFFLYGMKDYSTELIVPGIKALSPDLGIWYIPFGALVIVGTSNAFNLADGMDGLAVVPGLISMVLLTVMVYIVGHATFAGYLHLFFIAEAGELAIMAGALMGASLAFLWYNSYPAEIFMGDTGSLTIGAFMGMFTLITKTELLSIIFNGIFVIEALSVILQVTRFKISGRRFFLMAPIHHHFEMKMKGKNKEPKIVVRFWIVAILLAILSISLIKVR
ncbi:MAG: phospho-N-acetylmuramoyl-pentapeptide-transferase [bacterium]